MKSYLLFFLLMFSLASFSQQNKEFYLFNEFQMGKLIYKSGATTEGYFNYNTEKDRLLFLDADSTIMELLNPAVVSGVYINDRYFEHIKNGLCYEIIKVGEAVLYVRWHSVAISQGKTGAYGMQYNTSSIENYSTVSSPSGVAKLSINIQYNAKYKNIYYVKVKGKLQSFTSLNSLAKIFKNHQNEIKDAFKDENLNFENLDDVKKAVAYCAQYM
ncbi:MAG: hypothetical protein ACK5KT_14340 [Dysgonomonas sp.]